MTAVAPAATSRWWWSAAFVPVSSGLTVAAPWVMKSLIPSFGYGGDSSEREATSQVRLVVAEERLRRPAARKEAGAELLVLGDEPVPAERDRRLLGAFVPRPGVAEPERGEHVDRRRLRARVADAEAKQDVLGAGLGVVGGDLPVAAVVEDPGVDQLELRVELRPRAGSPRGAARTGTRPAGTCSASAAMSASASSRGTTSTPSRPRRDCRRGRRGRRSAPSGSGRGRSRRRARNTGSACRRRCRRGRPRSSGRRASAPRRAGDSPTRRRRRCSPRARSPSRARSGTAPSAATPRDRAAPREGASAPRRLLAQSRQPSFYRRRWQFDAQESASRLPIASV